MGKQKYTIVFLEHQNGETSIVSVRKFPEQRNESERAFMMYLEEAHSERSTKEWVPRFFTGEIDVETEQKLWSVFQKTRIT